MLKRLGVSGGPLCPVLVIDDDPAVRRTLRHQLEKQRVQVLEACNGREGLQQLEVQLPQLIILDLAMPEMDGFEFLSRLRAEDRTRELPVIVLTAKDLTPAERAQLSGNVERILEKPTWNRRDLLDELRRSVKGLTIHESRQPTEEHQAAL